MLREIGLFGAGVPSLLLYFLPAVPLFLVVIDWPSRSASTASSGIRHWYGSLSSSACFPVSSY
jgi:hypothetical protein